MAAAISTIIAPLGGSTIRRLTIRAWHTHSSSCGASITKPLTEYSQYQAQHHVRRGLLWGASLGTQLCCGRRRAVSSLAAAADGDKEAAPEPQEVCCGDAQLAQAGTHRVVNFYYLVDVADPEAELEEHRRFLDETATDVRGRIYISSQGINAQFSATAADAERYAAFVRGRPGFGGLNYSADPVDSHAFPKLRLKYKPNLVSLSGGHTHLPVTDPTQRAVKLSPAEWRQMLQEGAPVSPINDDGSASGVGELKKAVVLDIRNGYEWDVGHFEGAERPAEAEFRETPAEGDDTLEYLKDVDKDAPVMMYCTGGIRCDIYSTALRKQGYTNVYTLEGGIANYLRQEGGDHWNGSLFVFDNRMVLPGDLTEGSTRELSAAVPCEVCGVREAVLPTLNCANIDCNKLFLCCEVCRAELKGTCSEECTHAPRLVRPMKESGYYGSWKEYSTGEQGEASIASGRGEGRRRRRAKAQEEKRLRIREAKAERKQAARAAMAKVELEKQEQEAQQTA